MCHAVLPTTGFKLISQAHCRSCTAAHSIQVFAHVSRRHFWLVWACSCRRKPCVAPSNIVCAAPSNIVCVLRWKLLTMAFIVIIEQLILDIALPAPIDGDVILFPRRRCCQHLGIRRKESFCFVFLVIHATFVSRDSFAFGFCGSVDVARWLPCCAVILPPPCCVFILPFNVLGLVCFCSQKICVPAARARSDPE